MNITDDKIEEIKTKIKKIVPSLSHLVGYLSNDELREQLEKHKETLKTIQTDADVIHLIQKKAPDLEIFFNEKARILLFRLFQANKSLILQ